MPVYNAEATAVRSIESVLGQTYNNFELIIVDDGSTDGTYKKCKQFTDADSRVRVFSKNNGGPGAAREYGMQYVSGDYIAFIDADDYYSNELLAIVVGIFDKDKGCDIVEFDYKQVNIKGECTSFGNIKCEVLMGDNSLQSYVSQINTRNFLWNKVYKRKLFRGVIFPHLKAGEDSAVLTQLFYNSNKVVRLDTILYYYVQTEKSLTRAPWNPSRLDQIEAEKFINAFIKKNKPELSNYALQASCYRLAGIYYGLFNSRYPKKKCIMKDLKSEFNSFYFKIDKRNNAYSQLGFKTCISLWIFSFFPVLYCVIKNIRKRIRALF